MSAAIWFLLACQCTDRQDDTAEPEAWKIVGDTLGDAVLLGAWSSEEELLIVGGDLGTESPHGDLLRVTGDAACVEEALTEHPLWWIHGLSAEDWWAVGEAGTVLHWDGVYTRLDIPTSATLYGVFAAAEDSVWAVGGHSDTETGEIWHWDGEWTLIQGEIPGQTFKVWQDWIVGDGQAWRITGETVSAVPTDARLVTVRGRSSEDVYAVGGQGNPTVLHYEGADWEELSVQKLNGPVSGVWTAPGETVWVTGNYGVMAQLSEDGWEIPSFPLTSQHFHAVWQWDGAMWFVGGNLFERGQNHGTLACHGCEREISALAACE